MINVNDGYYYTIPPKWVGNIAILKDTDKRIREIYRFNTEEAVVGDSLIYFGAVKKSDWESGKYKSEDFQKIKTHNDTVFVCKISDTAKEEGITLDSIKKSFKIYGQE